MTRRSWLALALVALLVTGSLALRERPDASAPTASADLSALRTAAALAPCPAGLGPELPDLRLPCLGGGPDVDLRSAAPGRPMLVNVWATWCVPCIEEAPDLVAFAAKAGDRVGVVGVLTSDTAERGLAFSRDFGIGYPSLIDDDGAILRAYLPGPPVTLLLDPQGRVVATRSGAFDDLAEIESLVARHLGVML
jgi:thiol-disulfide isomerase/thioredoxin